MSGKMMSHDERAIALADHIQKMMVACDCAREFITLMDDHILHVSRSLPYETDKTIVERKIGEISFCNGLRDGVANALEAKYSSANEET